IEALHGEATSGGDHRVAPAPDLLRIEDPDVRDAEDDQTRPALCEIADPERWLPAGDDGLDVGVPQAAAPRRLDDDATKLVEGKWARDPGRPQGEREALQMGGELEDATAPRGARVEDCVTAQEPDIEDRDLRVVLRKVLPVDVDDQ